MPILDARFRAQVADASDDEAIRREAAIWRDATPEERLAAGCELGELLPWIMSRMQEGALERLRALDELSGEAVALLERLNCSS